MTLSIWRYSHLTLALVSGLFLVLASLTGIILAFEPMQSALNPYRPEQLSKISLAETIGALRQEYDEVLTLKVDANDFVVANVVNKTGQGEYIYVHPRTGKRLGAPKSQHPIFQFTTNLHRSLFLKGIGRFFVGLVSFLLCLIAITGLILIIKRQGGLTKLFSKVQKDYFELRYHVIFGRWFLVPISIVAATGVYLSAEKFSLLPSSKIVHKPVEPNAEVDMSVLPQDLGLFKSITLDKVRSVTFPFSEFPEDYFELALRKKELFVHQYSGEILSEQYYPFTFLASQISLTLHTGQGTMLWSIVLLLVSVALLFFIYSGFVMWRKRLRNSKMVVAQTDKDECTHIILVGSETGSTYAFAHALKKGLTQAGIAAFVSQINDYTTYAKAEQLIFLTATYGEGEAPSNARHIKTLLQSHTQKVPVQYSVVGFGSLTYPGYCQFAIDLERLLANTPNMEGSLPLYKINNQSFGAFMDWAKLWARATNTPMQIPTLEKKVKKAKTQPFKVLEKTGLNVDDTYMLHLKPKKKVKFQSGDLWEFVPEEGDRPRWYSVAKYQDKLVLSIKKHELGAVSQFLNRVDAGEYVKGGIKRNVDFHFPKSAPALVCIANGTGIAPFLGIIDENTKKIPIDLYWGGRTMESFSIYKAYIDNAIETKKMSTMNIALSQENNTKEYVQQLLQRDREQLAQKLENASVFMICGSIAMQRGVLEALEEITTDLLKKPLSEFEHREQLKMDCY